MTDALTPLIERHGAFWSRAEAGPALVGTSMWPETTTRHFDWGLPGLEGAIEPDMLSVGHFLPQYVAQFEAHGVHDGDMIWSAMPPLAVPWFEAIVGCRPHYSIPAGSMSGEPVGGDWTTFEPVAVLADNPWLRKLLEFTEGLVEVSGGRFPVGVPIGRGPWDVASAYLGMSSVYLELYDRPREIGQLAAKFADLWIEVMRRIERIIPPWRGGYVDRFGLWAPEFTTVPQDDASVSVSQAMYGQVMAAADREITEAWPSALFHLHSAGLQVADEVAAFLGDRALNVVLDPTGPSIPNLLPVFRRLQAAGLPLHVMVFSLADATALTAALEPRGLAIQHQPPDMTR
jgi:hypothetical protein